MRPIGENVLVLATPTLKDISEGTQMSLAGNSLNVNDVDVVCVPSHMSDEFDIDYIQAGSRVIVSEAGLSKNNLININGIDVFLIPRKAIRVVTMEPSERVFYFNGHQVRYTGAGVWELTLKGVIESILGTIEDGKPVTTSEADSEIFGKLIQDNPQIASCILYEFNLQSVINQLN